MHHLAVLLLALALQPVSAAPAAPAAPATKAAQLAALLKLKQALAPNLPGWLPNTDFCSWTVPATTPYTITCNAVGLISSLHAGDVASSQPYWVGSLQAVPDSVWSGLAVSLTSLSFHGTSISGSLPRGLAQLLRLEALDLGNTAVGGQLPEAWASLAALTSLALDNMAVTGTLPPAWGALTKLSVLSLNGQTVGDAPPRRCHLSGPLPASWSNLHALQILRASNCRLSGTLPGAWGAGLGGMQELQLANNQLTGTLPASWADLGAGAGTGGTESFLRVDVSDNQLHGTLPDAWSMGRFSALGLGSNKLTGQLPGSWGRLAAVTALNLSSNALSGPLPAAWGDLGARAYKMPPGAPAALGPTLQLIDLGHNALTGSIPATWKGMFAGNQPNIIHTGPPLDSHLLLSDNKLSGSIPGGSWPGLFELGLTDNAQLAGCIPKGDVQLALSCPGSCSSPTQYLGRMYPLLTSIAGTHIKGVCG